MNILNKKKKIAYVSGTRADFGLMAPVLRAIDNSKKLELHLYATGVHLMPEFGKTIDEVKKEFPGVFAIKAVFKTDDRLGTAKFTGDFLQKVIAEFQKNRPDFVLTLGDRPEMLCLAVACLYLGIPTGQIHGGEKTFTVDELARHAITKLSSIHFPATRESAERIEKMGEDKKRIYAVGAPALDVILNQELPDRKHLFRKLKMNPRQKTILLLQHPVSDEWERAGQQMREIMAAVKSFNFPVAVIYPHADAGGRKIIKVINKEKNNPLFRIFPSLSHKEFLALGKEAAVLVGNSSAAIIELPSFKTPVVNIGSRQLGRQQGGNIINVACDKEKIRAAIAKSLDDKTYLRGLFKVKNPWGDGKTSERIVKILEDLNLNRAILVKQNTY